MESRNSTAISAVPQSPPLDTANTIVPLPPQRAALPARTPPPEQNGLARADLLLSFFVVLLAFLFASTPARNSDLWLHLAGGRALADGSYRFAGDPFGQDANVWIAHTWLFDLLGFGLFITLGGTVLVILKALVVALLAALLIRLGTGKRGLVWPALAATLSLLAMSGRLLLQPSLASVVLLAATLWLLQRGRRRTEEGMGWLSTYGPLCVLFALWANLDDWVLLGPMTVGLCLVGELLAAAFGDKERTDVPGLTLALGVGLLACLLTPFHVRGLTVPAELGLSATARVLAQDPALNALFVSPFHETYFHTGDTWNIPGLMYFALAALSALSFAASRTAWRGWRLPLWLGLFALSAWSARAVPFFAVAAGPILALNVQDFAASFRGEGRREEFFWARLGRAAALVSLLGLLVAAWPGWLQGAPYEMRRWTVLVDASLRQAADKIAAWRDAGQLDAEARGFNFSPEQANYFAYFCPSEKGMVDARLLASPTAAADYVTVRRALLDPRPGDGAWRDILRTRRINHVVVHDSNTERVSAVFRRLIQHEDEWNLIALTGRTVLFGWKDPKKDINPLKNLTLNVHEEAYRPREAKKAPPTWPGREPEAPAWWSGFVSVRPSDTADRDEAALWLLDFETRAEKNRGERSLAWDASRIAGALGAGTPALSVRMQQTFDLYAYVVQHSDAPVRWDPNKPNLETLTYGLRMNYLVGQDDAPAEYLWLAIRAARRALKDNPNDAQTRLLLGEAYLRLLHGTRERVWITSLPILRRLRQVQASTALNQALLLQPDLIAAHDSLSMLYQDVHMWDLRLTHRREVLRLTEKKGASPGETLEEYQYRLSRLREEVEALSQDMTRAREHFDVNTANERTADRAVAATRRYGMGGRALELLLGSDAASFGQKGVGLELELLLTMGRVREVREWMSPDHRKTLGDEDYLEDRLLLAVACGDYDGVDVELAELQVVYNRAMPYLNVELQPRPLLALQLGSEILSMRLDRQAPMLHIPPNRTALLEGSLQMLTERLQRIANFLVLRGLFALERGDSEMARSFMERALETYQSGRGLDFGGRRIAEYYVKLLSAPGK